VAFSMAGGVVVSALTGQISLLPFALIPLIAGIGIMRGRAWGAYGLALFLFAQLLPVAMVMLRTYSRPPGTIGAICFSSRANQCHAQANGAAGPGHGLRFPLSPRFPSFLSRYL
jgi:hypothetical protein